MESVESHCKATHQVLAQACGHFFSFFFSLYKMMICYNILLSLGKLLLKLLEKKTFTTDSVGASKV